MTHPDARVRLLRVVETGPPATAVARPIRSVMRRVSRLVTAGEREARQVLGQRARAYQQAGLPRVTATVVRGDPRQTILREIARERADLVVVGATGSRAIRMMPGSIPEEILRRSGASVLVLRARPSGGAVELQ